MADQTGPPTKLQAVYHAQLPAKIERLAVICRALSEPPWSPERVRLAHRLAHNLAGAGALIGYSQLADTARSLARVLQPLRGCEQPPDPERLQVVSARLELLLAAAGNIGAPDERMAPVALPLPAQPQARAQTIIVIDDDLDEAQSLAFQLTYFGYNVHVLNSVSDLPELVRRLRPAALILDLMIPEGEIAGTEAATKFRLSEPVPPIVFLSQREDLSARLHAVRAGGSAYFPKPVDLNELVSTLDRLTNVAPPSPYRVLIVDDSAMFARAHATILMAAGMEAVIVIDPGALLHALSEHQPDLVLMDMYLPGCEGHELAAVIRQQPAFHGMPIVFLSGETNRERQLVAMGQGGDDFLTKPVKPAHLVAAVASRIERARAIRGQMNRDSLTGLLTHAAVKEQLARELARVQRYGARLSVVMLDVDHFKRVNDSFGHATGDRVLKSLARLLRQQLRASDVVGRYGGEEFVVLLPQTNGEDALTVIDRIRSQFARLQHQGPGSRAFTATFSAGIASIPPPTAATKILELADAALYTAKQAGRNQVLRAETILAAPAVSATPSP